MWFTGYPGFLSEYTEVEKMPSIWRIFRFTHNFVNLSQVTKVLQKSEEESQHRTRHYFPMGSEEDEEEEEEDERDWETNDMDDLDILPVDILD